MKFFKLLLVFLLMSSTNILAQDQGGISDFEVLPEYLINGKIKIDGDNSTTTFKYKVTFVKRLNPAWYSNSGLTKWLFTTVNFRLVSSLQNYSPYYMENNRQVTIADFPQDDEAFMEKEYTTTINNSYLITGRTIDLSYQTASMSFFGTKGTSYQFQVVVTPPTYSWNIPSPYPNSTPLQRLFLNSSPDAHHLTDNAEGVNLVQNHNWQRESLIGHIKNTQESGTVPLYRYYRSQNMDHFFTVSNSTPSGYIAEPIQGYVYTSPGQDRIPVYVYATKSGDTDHVYSIDFNELGSGNSTWRYDGIAFYVLQ